MGQSRSSPLVKEFKHRSAVTTSSSSIQSFESLLVAHLDHIIPLPLIAIIFDYSRPSQYYVTVAPHERGTTNGDRLLIYDYNHHYCISNMMIPWPDDGFTTVFRQRGTPASWLTPPIVHHSPPCALPLYLSYGTCTCDIVAITDGDIMGVMVYHRTVAGTRTHTIHLFLYSIITNGWITGGGSGSGCGGRMITFDGLLPIHKSTRPHRWHWLPSSPLTGNLLMYNDRDDGYHDYYMSLSFNLMAPKLNEHRSIPPLICYPVPSFPLRLHQPAHQVQDDRVSPRIYSCSLQLVSSRSGLSTDMNDHQHHHHHGGGDHTTTYVYHWRLITTATASVINGYIPPIGGCRLNTSTGFWSPVASPNIDPTGKIASSSGRGMGRMIPFNNHGILYLALYDSGGVSQWHNPSNDTWTPIKHWGVPRTLVNYSNDGDGDVLSATKGKTGWNISPYTNTPTQ